MLDLVSNSSKNSPKIKKRKAKVINLSFFLKGGTYLKKKLCSVILCVTLIFQVTFYDYYEAEAAAIPLGIGIWEIIQGLLLSAGVTYLTYEGIENMNSDDYVDIALASYLKESYDTNLRIIEGAASGQMPSSSPSPSPTSSPVTGLPGDQSQAPRYWDALITAFYENEMIEFTAQEWEAWHRTVENFINDSFDNGRYYDILKADSNFHSYFDEALSKCKELYPEVEYFPPIRSLIIKGSPLFGYHWDDTRVNDYLCFALPGTYCEKVEIRNTSEYGNYYDYDADYESHVIKGAYIQFQRTSLSESYELYAPETAGYWDIAEGFGFCEFPLTAPDVLPDIGDQPSKETITIVPEIQPDPDSEEKKYVIPDENPGPMKIPSTEQIGDLYNDIQDDPDNAPENLKTLQEELMLEPDPEPDPDTNPAPSVAPSAIPDVTVPENAGNYTYDFSDLFPFCIPKDFYNLLCVFNAKAKAPKFEIPFDISYAGIEYHKKFTLDMSEFEEVIKIFRLICIISFIVTLIWITRNFIKW